MPPLDQTTIRILTECLKAHLVLNGQADEPVFLNAGGSAAVFKAERNGQTRAYKVLDPRFLDGDNGSSGRRRLRLQKKLIGHSCPYLVEMHGIDETERSAIIEMEFCPWPQLSKCLAAVPDERVAPLISQLVTVVRYLEDLGIVHRDIKPENIHIAPDFSMLKVLDLGVARTFDASDTSDAEASDQPHQRPFLATAQYSSPEYLFRLDEPTPRLWKALNLYQVGAVLHDLIMKSALFEEEINLGNRWLVARAVLAKTPSFADTNPNRLAALKALAAKCLVKDMETRLQIVSWADFVLDSSQDPLSRLRSRLERRDPGSLDSSGVALESRLRFDRSSFEKGFIERVRLEMIGTCSNKLPLTVAHPSSLEPFIFEFAYSSQIRIRGSVRIEWLRELYSRSAIVYVGDCKVCTVAISEAEDQAVFSITSSLATLLSEALDLIESNGFPKTAGTYTVQSTLGHVEVD